MHFKHRTWSPHGPKNPENGSAFSIRVKSGNFEHNWNVEVLSIILENQGNLANFYP